MKNTIHQPFTSSFRLPSYAMGLRRLGVTMLTVVMLGLLGACGSATMRHSASADVRLVAIAPGVWVVEDHDYAVFYAEGSYWMLRDGVWWNSATYADGYVRVESAPTVVLKIERPKRYVHYHAPAGADTRPATRGRAVGHGHAPGLQPEHHENIADRQADHQDAVKARKAEKKAEKAEDRAEKKAEIADRKEERAEQKGTKRAQKNAAKARKDAKKADKKADKAKERAERKADKAEKKNAKAKGGGKGKGKE